MASGHGGPGPVPSRWLKCPRKAESLIGDRFLAFKTPLDERFDSQVPIENQFPPEMLFQLYRDKRQKLTLWVDLTNTTRFYNRRIVEDSKCTYIKMSCRGHGETPTQQQTQAFIELIEGHIREHPVDMIGVHCTHGFNRTGFLIVSYMVERMDYSVGAALMEFSKARPPGIYKQDYINELYERYDDIEDAIAAPERPDWCFEDNNDMGSDKDDDEYENQGGSGSGCRGKKRYLDDGKEGGEEGPSSGKASSAKVRRMEMVNPKAQFMSGVEGVQLMTDQQRVSKLQGIVQNYCHWKRGGFPGAQPVSMDRINIKCLEIKPYRVSWKADGTRYMMLICGKDEIYFFGRDFQCFRVFNLSFVHRQDLHRQLVGTLLDGEMVIDRDGQGMNRPRYLVYDIVHFENEDIGIQPFDVRRQYIKHEIVFPRYEAMKCGIIDKTREPFSVAVKDFWDITQAAALLGPKFTQKLLHEPDGLIFQPAKEPYQAGQCDDVLKWKPPELNSIDFRIRILVDQGEGILRKKVCHLFVGNNEFIAKMPYSKALKDMDNKIAECRFANGKWEFMRERTDKDFPNSLNTARAVCQSIAHPVTQQMLLTIIDKHRYKDDGDH